MEFTVISPCFAPHCTETHKHKQTFTGKPNGIPNADFKTQRERIGRPLGFWKHPNLFVGLQS